MWHTKHHICHLLQLNLHQSLNNHSQTTPKSLRIISQTQYERDKQDHEWQRTSKDVTLALKHPPPPSSPWCIFPSSTSVVEFFCPPDNWLIQWPTSTSGHLQTFHSTHLISSQGILQRPPKIALRCLTTPSYYFLNIRLHILPSTVSVLVTTNHGTIYR